MSDCSVTSSRQTSSTAAPPDGADTSGTSDMIKKVDKPRRKKKVVQSQSVFESTPAPSQADVTAGGVASGCGVLAEERAVFESEPMGSTASVGYSQPAATDADVGPSVFESQPSRSNAHSQHGANVETPQGASVFESAPAPSRASVSGRLSTGGYVAEAQEMIEAAADQWQEAPTSCVFESQPSHEKVADVSHADNSVCLDAVASSSVFESQPRPSVADVRADYRGEGADAARALIEAAAEMADEEEEEPQLARTGDNAVDEARALIASSAEDYDSPQFTFESAPTKSKAHVRHGESKIESESEYEYETDSEGET